MRPLPFFSLLLAASALPALAQSNAYVQTNLIANNASYHPQIVDPNLLDAWGIALRPPGAGGHIWISNAETGTSSEYIGDVNGMPLHQDGLQTVTLDTPTFTDHGYAFVTGQAYNSASDLPGQPVEFYVAGSATNDNTGTPVAGGYSGSAKFVFVTEDGAINAWSANTAVAMNSAPIIVNYSKDSSSFPYAANSVFTGDALTNNAITAGQVGTAAGNHLFATDFRNNAIEVFDDQWKDVTSSYTFATPADVGGLHPFNVADLGGHLFVTYAEFDKDGDEGQEQISAPGDGHVVEYNENGTLVKDFNDAGNLDAPWGMTIAPSTFGAFANDLLVANFGDGTISAFDLATGNFLGDLRDASGNVVSIDGIWGLTFGNGYSLGDANSLYFTAGPNGENDGLFGKLTVAAAVPEPTSLSLLGLAVGGFLLRRRRVVAGR
jgi:uncharacterized protein (TIGR03118 family)